MVLTNLCLSHAGFHLRTVERVMGFWGKWKAFWREGSSLCVQVLSCGFMIWERGLGCVPVQLISNLSEAHLTLWFWMNISWPQHSEGNQTFFLSRVGHQGIIRFWRQVVSFQCLGIQLPLGGCDLNLISDLLLILPLAMTRRWAFTSILPIFPYGFVLLNCQLMSTLR